MRDIRYGLFRAETRPVVRALDQAASDDSAPGRTHPALLLLSPLLLATTILRDGFTLDLVYKRVEHATGHPGEARTITHAVNGRDEVESATIVGV